jgi:hypothetical protein
VAIPGADDDTSASVLVCAPNGEDLGGGICGGVGAGLIRTSECCSGFARWHCHGDGEDASVVCVAH